MAAAKVTGVVVVAAKKVRSDHNDTTTFFK